MSGAMEIYDKLEDAKDQNGNGNVSVGDVLDSLKHKGFGAFFIAPAMITILPTGAIPGVPAACGILLFLIAVQIVFGRESPWIPNRIKNFEFSEEKYKSAVAKAKPYIQKIDKYIHPRLELLTKGIMKQISAIVAIALSIAIITVGFIPMAPALFGSAILWIGIGFSARDGALILLGYIQAAVLCAVVPMWL